MSRWKEFDETQIAFGIYVHKKNGKIAIAEPPEDKKYDWNIDKNIIKNHPIFRIKQKLIAEGTGNFFFNKHLRDYEHVGEL